MELLCFNCFNCALPLPGAALDLSKYRPASFPGEGWMPSQPELVPSVPSDPSTFAMYDSDILDISLIYLDILWSFRPVSILLKPFLCFTLLWNDLEISWMSGSCPTLNVAWMLRWGPATAPWPWRPSLASAAWSWWSQRGLRAAWRERPRRNEKKRSNENITVQQCSTWPKPRKTEGIRKLLEILLIRMDDLIWFDKKAV